MNGALQSPLLASIGIRDRQTLGWIQAKAPLLLSIAMQPMRDTKRRDQAEQLARAQRVGRDPRAAADHGHSIRLQAAYDHVGMLLRPSDVEVDDGGDITDPSRTVRRARRIDTLWTLKKTGAIEDIDYQAGELFRDQLEQTMTGIPAGTVPTVRTAPWGRIGCNDMQRKAMACVRVAVAHVPSKSRLTLLWVLSGGSIAGLAKLTHRHHQSVKDDLRDALATLVDHFGLRYREGPQNEPDDEGAQQGQRKRQADRTGDGQGGGPSAQPEKPEQAP